MHNFRKKHKTRKRKLRRKRGGARSRAKKTLNKKGGADLDSNPQGAPTEPSAREIMDFWEWQHLVHTFSHNLADYYAMIEKAGKTAKKNHTTFFKTESIEDQRATRAYIRNRIQEEPDAFKRIVEYKPNYIEEQDGHVYYFLDWPWSVRRPPTT